MIPERLHAAAASRSHAHVPHLLGMLSITCWTIPVFISQFIGRQLAERRTVKVALSN